MDALRQTNSKVQHPQGHETEGNHNKNRGMKVLSSRPGSRNHVAYLIASLDAGRQEEEHGRW